MPNFCGLLRKSELYELLTKKLVTVFAETKSRMHCMYFQFFKNSHDKARLLQNKILHLGKGLDYLCYEIVDTLIAKRRVANWLSEPLYF